MGQKNDNTALAELKAAIKAKAPERLYVFYGEEVFLLNHYLEQLKKILLDELTESFNYHRLTSETFDIQTFADSVENMPMMAEHTLVQVDDVDFFKTGESEREKIAQILSDIPEYCTVVLTYETTPWKPDKRMAKLWNSMQAACIVDFAKQEQRDLIPWIIRHFHARNKRISPNLCAYLIEITGGTMTALSGEIAKICAYSGADEIVKEDIDAVTEPVLEAVAFQMADLLAAGKYSAALEKLNTLFKMQQEPIAVLGAVGSHYRRLAAARVLADNGKGYGELMKLSGAMEYPAKKAMDACRRFTPAYYKKAMELILETDYRMKTSFDDQERLLEVLLLQLAQEARRD